MKEYKSRLFLDDTRKPWDSSWHLVKDASEFKDYIRGMYKDTKKIPEWVSCDHDLHYEHFCPRDKEGDMEWYNKQYSRFIHETGLDCAKWLCSFCVDKGINLPEVHIHSANKTGANNIAYELMNMSLFYFEEELIIHPTSYSEGSPIKNY